MFAGIETLTAAATTPVLKTDAEFKPLLRITGTDSDDELDFLISAATGRAEETLGKALIDQTLRVTYDWRCGARGNVLIIPRPPLSSITTLEYRDTAGAWVTLATTEYEADSTVDPARIFIRTIPGDLHGSYAPYWRLEYVAGYGAAGSDVPAPIRHAMIRDVENNFDGCTDEEAHASWMRMILDYRTPPMAYDRAGPASA